MKKKLVSLISVSFLTLTLASCGDVNPTQDPTVDPTVTPTEPTVDPTDPTVDPTEPTEDPTKGSRDIYSDLDDSEEIDESTAVTVTGNLSRIVNPPFLHKIDMYNAGCINPVSYYERDMDLCKQLNFNSLRVDLSAGKENGNGGQFMVEEECETSEVDENGDYSINTDSLGFDFTDFDELMTYFVEMDALPYMSWCYIPFPLQENGYWKKFNDHVTNWQDVWEECYYQYVKHCVDNNVKIGYHELYNEPDLEMIRWWNEDERDTFAGFLDYRDFAPDGDPSKGKYFDMYKYGAEGVLRADPDATVGGPAYAIGETAAWSGLIKRIAQENVPMDFFSFHSYMDGETWYMSDESRASGSNNELEQIVHEIANYPQHLNTQIHISEFSPLNDDNGAKEGSNSSFNTYRGASRTFTAIEEIVNRTSIQLVSWAQLMSVNSTKNDAYGIIDKEGNAKSSYNALRIYSDLPVFRYGINSDDSQSGIKSFLAADNDKVSIVLWNENSSYDEDGNFSTEGDREVCLKLKDCWLDNATRRVYRIDEDHATSYDYAENPLLEAQNVRTYNSTDEKVWSGNIPAEATVYITINRGANRDFDFASENVSFCNLIKNEYWYEDRYRKIKGNDEYYQDYEDDIHGSFAQFDRKTMTAYLGVGECAGKRDGSAKKQGVALTSAICDELPTKITIRPYYEGKPSIIDDYSNLGVRIDFYDDSTKEYTNSCFFYDGVYSTSDYRNQDTLLSDQDEFPFGTKEAVDEVYLFNSNTDWEINLENFAPDGWENGTRRAAISFYMRNTGVNTRASFKVMEG